MNDFMINLFIPRTQDGSAAAIAAHIYAKENNGAVSIARYYYKEDLSNKFRELAHYIAVADDNNLPQPKRRIIWVVAEHDCLDKNIFGEVEQLLERGISGIRCKHATDSNELYSRESWELAHLPGLNKFFYHLKVQDFIWRNIKYLYNMLDADEFEHLMAYLLQAHPTAEDVTKEDYVLSLFVEHEKKRRASYE